MKRIYIFEYVKYTNAKKTDLVMCDLEAFKSEHKAINRACYAWWHLTAREQKHHDLYAGYIDIPDDMNVFESDTIVPDTILTDDFIEYHADFGYVELWHNGTIVSKS